MSGTLRAELYKIVNGKFIYLALGLTICSMMLINIMVPPNGRLEYHIHIMPDIMLSIICISTGSIFAQEYSMDTIKDVIISSPNRRCVFLSKLLVSFISIFILFCIYSTILITGSKIYDLYVILNMCMVQFIIVIAQVFIVIFFSIVLRSFSYVALSSVLMFIVYHIFDNIGVRSKTYGIAKITYLCLFHTSGNIINENVNITNFLIFLVVASIFLLFGYIHFLEQEI